MLNMVLLGLAFNEQQINPNCLFKITFVRKERNNGPFGFIITIGTNWR
jgi:hypothetical protein